MENYQEVVDSAIQYIPKLVDGINELLDKLRSGNIRDMDTLGDIADGLNWLFSAVTLVCEAKGKPVPDNLPQMNENIKDILDALLNTDFVLIADLLEYEVQPILKEWDTFFSEMNN